MHHVLFIVEMVFFFGGIIAFGLWQIHSINKRQRARAEAAAREAAGEPAAAGTAASETAATAPGGIRVVRRP